MVLTSKAEEFRARATNAEKAAEAATDRKIKAEYLDMAQEWRKLADLAERENW